MQSKLVKYHLAKIHSPHNTEQMRRLCEDLDKKSLH